MPITYEDIKKSKHLDCSKLKDLRGRYIHNRVLINYNNIDFKGCVLYRCFPSGIPNALEVDPLGSEDDAPLQLQGADLRGAKLVAANLKGGNFSGAIMGNTADDFDEDYIVLLNEADLRKANLSSANLNQASFEHADLRFANLSSAKLMMANFNNANLEGANLRYANLYVGELDNANLKGADLRFSTLLNASMDGAVYDSTTKFEGSGINKDQLSTMIFIEDED